MGALWVLCGIAAACLAAFAFMVGLINGAEFDKPGLMVLALVAVVAWFAYPAAVRAFDISGGFWAPLGWAATELVLTLLIFAGLS